MSSPALESTTAAPALLAAAGICAGYGKSQVLEDVSISVAAGEVVSVLGHNGAGKTSLLKTLFGILRPSAGTVLLDGSEITNRAAFRRVQDGMVFSPADAAVFGKLSVADNLALGAFSITDRTLVKERLDYVIETFPIIEGRLALRAGTLSGGERRMVSLGMALMARPKVLLLNEPSNGIAPAVVERIFGKVRQLARDNQMAVVLVEQNVRAALRVSDRAYFLRHGKVILEETAEVALARGQWWDLF